MKIRHAGGRLAKIRYASEGNERGHTNQVPEDFLALIAEVMTWL